jgi:hypothetical protein
MTLQQHWQRAVPCCGGAAIDTLELDASEYCRSREEAGGSTPSTHGSGLLPLVAIASGGSMTKFQGLNFTAGLTFVFNLCLVFNVSFLSSNDQTFMGAQGAGLFFLSFSLFFFFSSPLILPHPSRISIMHRL